MDVAGYNYGIKRYHHDLKKYPKRIILGSETFCADAYRFMQEAKRQHLLKNIPVIAITSEDSPLKLDRLMNLGICEIIQKPFTPSVIKNRIDYMVKLQSCTK